MGWITFHETRSAKEYFLQEWQQEEDSHRILDIAIVNFREAYMAMQCKNTGQITAAVCLLHRAPKDYYNFGYKSMDEFCGPCVYNCPERILKLLSPLDEVTSCEQSKERATNWREGCQEIINRRKLWNKGGVVQLGNPLLFGGQFKTEYFRKEGRKTIAIVNYGTPDQREVQVRIRGGITNYKLEKA